MTGKEKIQAVIDTIDEKYQSLIKGNVVHIYSGALSYKGVDLDEQKQILDILSEERKVIKYTATPVYKTEDEIDYEMLLHIKEEAYMDGVLEREMIEDLLKNLDYKVEVLAAFDPSAQPTDQPTANKNRPAPKKIEVHQLMPQHYSDRTGVLTLSPTDRVEIAKRGKAKRSNGKKYDQCWLMECLFKSVNTLNNGITFSTFLPVKYDKNNKKHIKKVRNTVDEINKKVADKGGPKNLIKLQGEKVFVNSSYL